MPVIVQKRIGKTRLLQEGRARADRAIKFISQLKHSTGEWAGKPFILMDWQEGALRRFYGTLKPDGTRQYRNVLWTTARKNGKTEIAGGGFILPLLYLDDEPGAQIYGAANDQGQANLLFNAVAPMVEQCPGLLRRSSFFPKDWRKSLGSKVQKRIVYYDKASFYATISSEAYTKDGLNPHGIVYDELHAAPNRELWDVLTTAQGARRQPAVVVTSTAGYDRHSIYREQYDYACKVRDGIIDDPTWLVLIYEAPETADWTDEDVWKLANPALGKFLSLDEMRTACKKAQEAPANEMTFRRLRLNQWVNSVIRWLPMDKWDACSQTVELESLKGRPCYGAIDLSSNIDLTALGLVFPRENGYDVIPHFWIPEDTAAEAEKRDRVPYREWARRGFIHLTPGNVVDYGFIRQTLREVRGLYDLKELAYDRWGAAKFIQDLEEDGFLVDPEAIKKNKFSTAPVVVPFGQGFASMSGPTKELMTLVLQQQIRHGGHPVLRWNADNMVVAMDPAGNLKPDKAKATQKIDGMVALIMALDRAIRHKGEDEPSIYETRGPIIFG
mgnify:CR=1 FL=1